MGRVGLRSIRAHLGRFLLSLLAVTLGVAFVAGTFSLRSMMSSSFDGIVESSASADVYLRAVPEEGSSVVSGSTSTTTFPLSLVDEVREVDGVDVALPALSGDAVLVGKDGTAVQNGMAPSMGLLWSPDDPMMTDFVEGRGPERAGEVALETQTLEASGLAVGDTTTVILAGEISEAEVVGEIDPGSSMMGATIVFVDYDTGLDLWVPDGQISQIEVRAADGVDAQTLVDRLDPLAPEGTEVLTGQELRDEQKAQIDDTLGFVTTFLLIFAAIALFVGAFIISNTFAMSVRQRMREFAMLRAVGASPGQVFSSILVQAAVVGLVGSVLGVLAGLGLVEVVAMVMRSMGMNMSDGLPLDVTTVVVSLLVGTVVSVVAAAVPARKAALVPPVEAMRDDVTVPEKSLHRRAWAGGVLTLVGVGAAVLAVLRPEEDWATSALGGGAIGVLVGVLMLSPVLSRSVVGVLAWPFVRLIRPVGRLARGNVVRNPRRTANTAGALMIGMALVGAVSVIAVSAKDSVGTIVDAQTDGDVVVIPAGSSMLQKSMIDELREIPEAGVVDAIYFSGLSVGAADDPAGAAVSYVAGLDEGLVGRSVDLTLVDGDLTTIDRGEALVQESAATSEGWQVGDRVVISGSSGTLETTVGAVVSTEVLGAPWLISTDELAELVPATQMTSDAVIMHVADGSTVQDLQDAATEVAKPYLIASVLTADEWVSSLAAQVDQILVVLYALLGLSVVIAVLGIVNTLAMSVIERTREIGLLRAVGLGRLQLSGTVVVESVLTAVYGTVIGLLIGVGLAATLPTLLSDMGLSTLVIPWAQLSGMVALSVVVGVVAALWPAVRAARMDVLEAISYE